jgi:hypothetical protein
MIDGFDLNEKLKETLVMQFSAFEAKSQIFNDGVPLIPEPFLETIVRWDKDVDPDLFAKALQFIVLAKLDIDKIADMTDPEIEISMGHPQVVWATFNLEEK